MSDAAAGRGRAMVIEGSAGSGKTALLQAAAERAPPTTGWSLLAARGSQIEQEFPFGLARQLLEPPLSALAAADRDRLLDGPAQPALLAVAPERALDDGAPPEGFAMLHALHLVATGLAQDRPRLLVVDDAHWGDASSLRALSYLAGRLAATPLVLAISFRPAEPGAPEDLLDQLRAEPGVLSLTPTPLGPASVATLVRQRLPTADDDACRAAADVTAGNPLYVTELLRAVAQVGNGSAAAASIQRAALPSLGDRVSRRIARVADRGARAGGGDGRAGRRQLPGHGRRAGGRVAGGGGPDRPQPAPDRDPGLRRPRALRPPAGPQLRLRLADHRRTRRAPRFGRAAAGGRTRRTGGGGGAPGRGAAGRARPRPPARWPAPPPTRWRAAPRTRRCAGTGARWRRRRRSPRGPSCWRRWARRRWRCWTPLRWTIWARRWRRRPTRR